jgi:HEPN domain-containing protein
VGIGRRAGLRNSEAGKLREETEPWWRQAQADLHAAGMNAEDGLHFVVTWLSQQAAGKALKAVWIERHNEPPPRTHDLPLLGSRLGVPGAVADDLEALMPAFDRARYPDDVGEPPVDAITEELAREHLGLA